MSAREYTRPNGPHLAEQAKAASFITDTYKDYAFEHNLHSMGTATHAAEHTQLTIVVANLRANCGGEVLCNDLVLIFHNAPLLAFYRLTESQS